MTTHPSSIKPYFLHRQHGATLLLLVLIIGIAAAFTALSALNKSASPLLVSQAEMGSLIEVRDALMGFAAINKRLPCPAKSATDGNEKTACTTDTASTGLIPWTTLGVQKLDSWGKIIRYSVSPAFANEKTLPTSTSIPTKFIQTRDTAGTFKDQVGNQPCSTANKCSPAIIYSSGNANFGTSTTGAPIRNSSIGNTNLDERTNDTATNNFINRPLSTDTTVAGGEFDDLLTWIDYEKFKKLMKDANHWN